MTEARTRANILLEEAAKPGLEEMGSALRELGLGANAAEVFCALVRRERATAGELVLKTGIPDSKIYYALDELAERGLIEVQPGKPKRHRVLPSREVAARLERLVEERAERSRASAKRVASLLEPLRSSAASPETDIAYVVKGEGNVLARARSMIESARKEVIMLASQERFVRPLEEALGRALARRVKVMLAVPEMPLEKELERRAEIRRVVCDCAALVVDGVQILSVNRFPGENAYGITSTDATLVRMGREYWESPQCCAECG